MIDDERSVAARAVAELALVRLLAASAPTSESMIVLGGLVPPTLTSDLPSVPRHLGTNDVDILLVTHLTADRNLSPIEDALRAMAFSPDVDGWRWRGRIEGRVVKIEFICDLDDQPAEAIVAPKGCSELRAEPHEHAVPTRTTTTSPMCSCTTTQAGPWPRPTSSMPVDSSQGSSGCGSTILELRERFRDDRAYGAQVYAEESLKVTPQANRALLAAEAAAAVNEFLAALKP